MTLWPVLSKTHNSSLPIMVLHGKEGRKIERTLPLSCSHFVLRMGAVLFISNHEL